MEVDLEAFWELWAWILFALLVAFVIAESYALYSNKATLSEKVREWSGDWPIVPFLFGFGVGLLGGHWFWCAC